MKVNSDSDSDSDCEPAHQDAILKNEDVNSSNVHPSLIPLML